ncbi:uncharacterized protein BO66DRAFT_387886 [Aspergillus aculeatinus CBS 121060]|uniref:Uncharacterized protein n=1 Tax=Aspergillus aculeatinus CBS 121060 TaxID=1448322 RepID=A0ACD1HLT6_9EURO|nr:hypothetical protein BO66DRAFT_387886 [Aspergillus aculeatinus CBS 121060]RAH74432.1 hypothetical protein BO66DRAFT_387886 [Aspergillus aculeatinus CBS 121060]
MAGWLAVLCLLYLFMWEEDGVMFWTGRLAGYKGLLLSFLFVLILMVMMGWGWG